MYAICSTRKGNVEKHVKQMVKKNLKGSVYQFLADDYDKLSKNRTEAAIIEATQELACENAIDIKTGTLHKITCQKANDVVRAHIINPKATGLKLCKCMK
jgi:hypothetical protein